LKAKGEFKRTLSGRRLCGNQFFVLYGLATSPIAGSFSDKPPFASGATHPTRIGFIVSKKIHKRATQRNLIRRRLRELVRLYLQQTKATGFQGYRTLVFIARPESLGVGFHDLKHKMERCLQNIRP
jgi:ribonuclease P protein component